MTDEILRNAFGSDDDFSEELEEMFGEHYLDGPDDTNSGIPPELRSPRVRNISGIVDRIIESTRSISCEDNQSLLRKYIVTGDITLEDSFSTTIHSEQCPSDLCHRLQKITILDKYFNLADLQRMAREEGLL